MRQELTKISSSLIEDIKGKNGHWLQSTVSEGYSYKTRAGSLWTGINSRCKVGGRQQTKFPACIGCENLFSNFNSFAEWCQGQKGYMEKDDRGRFWQIDKDIIKPYNKIYSSETSCFVPSALNKLLLFSNSARGDYPLGVTLNKKEQRFYARTTDGNHNMKHIGIFDDPMDAHKAWQINKISQIDLAIESHAGIISNAAINGLVLQRGFILNDVKIIEKQLGRGN